MLKKIALWSAGAGATLAGLVAAFAANAQVFTVPTSTATNLTADVSSQLGDVGTLALIVIVAAIPLVFYVIHQLLGLVPKSRGRRQ
jgi:NAD(P)H-hydrate repair Nnr-like enzyme with NAD(P)H-hydrate dehydratase domain